MEFLDPKLDEYIQKHTIDESELLNQLNRDTHLKVLMPRMLSGHVQGRMLSMLSHMVQPKYILEIGTYTGYSALCLAEGLKDGGKLITIDNNEELKSMHEEFIGKSGFADNIEILYGQALDIIDDLEDGIDMVFIDADKENYSNYFDQVIDKVRPGGFILADNVLWSGKVIQEVKPNDKSTNAIIAFHKKVHDDPRVENVLFPVRDGIMVLRKL
ncbi:MAG: O-methyltransferase [Flavobacteriales bacterium]|nr:O-methyltransferase [Flavobacteriales bacterium]